MKIVQGVAQDFAEAVRRDRRPPHAAPDAPDATRRDARTTPKTPRGGAVGTVGGVGAIAAFDASPDAAPDAGPRFRRLVHAAWAHPEWWSVVLSAIAWVLFIVRPHLPTAGAAWSHGHADHGTTMATMTMAWSASGGGRGWLLEIVNWGLMVMAMMVPLVLVPVRTTAARSLWRRRHRAIGGFLVGYLAPWLVFGLAASVAAAGLRLHEWLSVSASAALGFAVAAAWQLTPEKRRALLACHRTTPIAPRGWRADRDCVRYGWMIGARCVVSCWALMLACLLAGHGVAAMVSASLIGAAERYMARPSQRVICGLLCGLALIYAALAFSSLVPPS